MLVCIQDQEIYNRCFKEWLDARQPLKNNNDLRCAIVAYSLYVRNNLLDWYDVNMEEGECDED